VGRAAVAGSRGAVRNPGLHRHAGPPDPERLRSLSGHAPAQETEPEPEPELAGKSDVRLAPAVPASTGRSGHRRRDAAGTAAGRATGQTGPAETGPGRRGTGGKAGENGGVNGRRPARWTAITDFPRRDLLTNGDPPRARSKANDTMIEAISGVLEQFSVDAQVTGFTRGPTVTRYEVELGPGVKVEKITALTRTSPTPSPPTTSDCSRRSPESRAVGIEVPNSDREMVRLGDVLKSQRGAR